MDVLSFLTHFGKYCFMNNPHYTASITARLPMFGLRDGDPLVSILLMSRVNVFMVQLFILQLKSHVLEPGHSTFSPTSWFCCLDPKRQ